MTDAYKPSTWEFKIGGSGVLGQHGLRRLKLKREREKQIIKILCMSIQSPWSTAVGLSLKNMPSLPSLKQQGRGGKTHVFLACPSWKHICPTRAADWSPKHWNDKWQEKILSPRFIFADFNPPRSEISMPYISSHWHSPHLLIKIKGIRRES